MAAYIGPATMVKSYFGDATITFRSNNETGLSVAIETERLRMQSVVPEDCEAHIALASDPDVMKTFATGEPRTREFTTKRVDTWVKRWKDDPYSVFSVFRKEEGDFIGLVALEHGDKAGESELAYIFHKKCWKQGYGKESVKAVVKEYAPATVKEGYRLEGRPLETIVATARPDNEASWRILESAGMKRTGTKERHGAPRYCYAIKLQKETPKGSWCAIL